MGELKPFYKSKTFWANLVGIVVMIVQSRTGFIVGPEYQAGILAVINLVLRGVTKEPIDWKLDKVAPLVLLLILPASLMLGGCSAIKQMMSEDEVVTELIVRAATGRVLAEKPEWVDDTFDITRKAITLAESDGVISLDELENYVIEQIDWQSVTPEEQALIVVLMGEIREEIEKEIAERYPEGEADDYVAVALKILAWINQTAAVRL